MPGLQVSIFCPFCKRHTALYPAPVDTTCNNCDHRLTTRAFYKSEHQDLWWIGICSYCSKPVLVHNEGDTVYPHPLPSPTDKRIPSTIRNDLDEAKLCLSINAYRACAVMARRAMQSTCIDKGATKQKLVDQLQELASNGIITKDLKDWANVVRWVGNDAAHPDSPVVNKEDTEDILNLSEQFLHVVYVAPAIAKERRTKRGK